MKKERKRYIKKITVSSCNEGDSGMACISYTSLLEACYVQTKFEKE